MSNLLYGESELPIICTVSVRPFYVNSTLCLYKSNRTCPCPARLYDTYIHIHLVTAFPFVLSLRTHVVYMLEGILSSHSVCTTCYPVFYSLDDGII